MDDDGNIQIICPLSDLIYDQNGTIFNHKPLEKILALSNLIKGAQMKIVFFLFLPIISSFDTTMCGIRKDCVFSPPGCLLQQCAYFISFASADEWTTFEMATTNISRGTNYLAVGLSEDELMGEDPVTYCYFPEGGTPILNVGFNSGKSNKVADESMKPLILNNFMLLHSEHKENNIFCSFRQRIKPRIKHEMIAHLNNNYFILMARGSISSPEKLGKHSLSPSSSDFPFISPTSFNITHFFSSSTLSFTEVSSTTSIPSSISYLSVQSRLWMIKIHGVLMVIPWLSLIPSSIISARYLRNEWKCLSPGGVHLWFHPVTLSLDFLGDAVIEFSEILDSDSSRHSDPICIARKQRKTDFDVTSSGANTTTTRKICMPIIHRVLNWISLILLIISTLLVLIAKDFKWKGPWPNKPPGKSTSPGALHSLIGTISLIGIVIQFISAYFRPSPDSIIRPYFNTFHRFVGIFSLLSALVATLVASFFFLKYWTDTTKAFLLTLISSLFILSSFLIFEVIYNRNCLYPTNQTRKIWLIYFSSFDVLWFWRRRTTILRLRTMRKTSIEKS
ncbi:hypothetical protein PRIPAC_91482 [Pristionchus pacificus]|uniref:Uncharacterized protein n=1 Tax=Pristionchus pacificus TaxID=54126 RepID=A0A2A6BWF0_PRIPA|nr:hypothetical protein PRIPAC_91482 [Pristionchus pacificus]|eukprot:PDM70198.1 hypothetical protein PRIPAC_45549 [Pristionchus pacificus]